MKVFKLMMNEKKSTFLMIPAYQVEFYSINFVDGFGEIYTDSTNFDRCIKFYDSKLPGFTTLKDFDYEMAEYFKTNWS